MSTFFTLKLEIMKDLLLVNHNTIQRKKMYLVSFKPYTNLKMRHVISLKYQKHLMNDLLLKI